MPSPRISSVAKRRRIAAASLATSIALIGGTVLSLQPFVASAADAGTPAPVVSDSFERNVAAGLGSAAVGGAYTVHYQNGNPFSVDGHNGKISAVLAGKSAEAYLPSASLGDGEAQSAFGITTSLSTAKLSLYHGVELRRQSDGSSYRAKVHVATNGTLTLDISRTKGATETFLGAKSISTTLGASSSLIVDAQISGTSPVTVSARAYIAGTTVPGWALSVQDSSAARVTGAGSVGFWDYADTTSPSVAVRLDSLTATPASSSPPPATTTTTPAAGSTGTLPGWFAPSLPTPRLAGAGSAPVGSTAYAIPSGALFVSPSGSDSNPGTQAAPKRTVAATISAAGNGATIVLRAGTYHESIYIPSNKKLTIQSYPHEAAWFDGATTVTGWAQSGSTWSVGNWTTKFDSSPTYTRGAADGTTTGWQWLNPSYPMAAHPDQVFIDGVPQTQVASLAKVTAGSFFVDYSANRLYLGSNPAGHTVYASTLIRAFSVNSSGTVLRGIGIARYAPSVPDMGAVASNATLTTLENVVIAQSATGGLDLSAGSDTLRNVTVADSGEVGVQGSRADNLTLSGVYFVNNNDQHFNQAPVAGGLKLTSSRVVNVTGSEFDGNDGPGAWFDASTYDINVTRNVMMGNLRYGIDVEISGTPTIINNYIANNVQAGVRLTNASNVTIWNNTIVNNNRALDIEQDSRRSSQPSTPGHDTRRPIPDPTVPWIWGPMSIANNIFETSTGNTIVGFEDHTHTLGASQSGISMNGNVYQRSSASAPGWIEVWARAGTDPAVYTTLGAFASATGQDRSSVELAHGANAVSSNGAPSSAVTSLVGSVAQATTSTVSGLTGFAVGSRSLGSSVRLG